MGSKPIISSLLTQRMISDPAVPRLRRRGAAAQSFCRSVQDQSPLRAHCALPPRLRENKRDSFFSSSGVDLRRSGLESSISDKRVTALGITSKIFQPAVIIRLFIKSVEARQRKRGNGDLLNRKTRKSGHAIFLDRSGAVLENLIPNALFPG